LLEVLIAVTLVSLLSTGLLMATRVGLNSMEAVKRRTTENRRTTGAHRILEEQLGGFMPVVAQCGGMMQGGGAPAPFFQGEMATMRFVTTYSLAEGLRGAPRIAEIFVAPGAEGRGVRLLVNEYLYGGPYGAGQFCLPPGEGPGAEGASWLRWRAVEAGPASFVLADKLAYARFGYKKMIDREAPDIWLPRWIERNEWPRAIRIEMGPLEADPSRVQPTSITMPVRITRSPVEFTR
jgi:hypothetical protein